MVVGSSETVVGLPVSFGVSELASVGSRVAELNVSCGFPSSESTQNQPHDKGSMGVDLSARSGVVGSAAVEFRDTN